MAYAQTSVAKPQIYALAQPGKQRLRPDAALPCLHSQDLFRDGNHELLIEHRGQCYRLRLTRQDKLILTK
tara:strand:- start:832 stop:1041 length:210 start_codon:yes stop_codon:yes gene_type:complete